MKKFGTEKNLPNLNDTNSQFNLTLLIPFFETLPAEPPTPNPRAGIGGIPEGGWQSRSANRPCSRFQREAPSADCEGEVGAPGRGVAARVEDALHHGQAQFSCKVPHGLCPTYQVAY